MNKTKKKRLALVKVLIMTVVCVLLLLPTCELPSHPNSDNGKHIRDGITYSKDMKTLISVDKNITHVSILDTVTKIDSGAFSGCTGLRDIDLSACASLTKIGRKAFENCTGLTTVRFPASLTQIDGSTFKGCSNLHTLTVDSANTFYCSKDNVIYIKDMKTLVCAARKITQVFIPDTVIEIDRYAFEGCTDLMEIRLPESISYINSNAFQGCNGLTSLDFSECKNFIELGYAAFSDCTGLTEVSLPVSLTQIDGGTFSGCSNLHTLIVDPANKTYCSKDNVLYTKDMKTLVCAARSIMQVFIPNTVTKIASRAFSGCTHLIKVRLPDSLTSIGSGAFSGCTSLKNIDFLAYTNLTEIGALAFSGCTGLDNVLFPESLTSIGGSAFYNCTGLESVYLPASVRIIDFGAFRNSAVWFRVATKAVKELLKKSGIREEQISVWK